MPEGAVMTGLYSDKTRAACRAAFDELMDTMPVRRRGLRLIAMSVLVTYPRRWWS